VQIERVEGVELEGIEPEAGGGFELGPDARGDQGVGLTSEPDGGDGHHACSF
jgi:hypothetical protein